MSSTKPTRESEKKAIGGELVIPIAALLFTLYYFSTIIHSPWTAQVSAFFIGTILILLVLGFIVKSALAVRRGEASLSLDSLVAPMSFVPKRLILLALTLGFIVFVHWGGFTLSTFAFLGLAMLTLNDGRKLGFIVILAGALSLSGYLLFILAFETRFPKGPFEQLIEKIF